MLTCICISYELFFNSLIYFTCVHIFFHNKHSWTIQQYLSCLCCWHIWMHKILFQIWKIPPLPPFRRISHYIQWLFCQWEWRFIVIIKYPIYNYTHSMIGIVDWAHYLQIITWSLISLRALKMSFVYHSMILYIRRCYTLLLSFSRIISFENVILHV